MRFCFCRKTPNSNRATNLFTIASRNCKKQFYSSSYARTYMRTDVYVYSRVALYSITVWHNFAENASFL